MSKKINEDMHLEKEWHEEAKKQTLETLPKFIDHLMHDYDHDYGTIVKAMACAMFATFNICNEMDEGYNGLTGFQASFIPWQIMTELGIFNSKSGKRIQLFDDLLFPQYEHKFNCISTEVWEEVQELAKENYKDAEAHNFKLVHPSVVEHWKSIIDGKVPFGLKVVDENI